MEYDRLSPGLFALILIAFLLSRCTPGLPMSTKAHEVSVKEITLTNADNVELAGTLFRAGSGDIGIVMAHSGVGGEDRTGLHPLAREVAEKGFTVVTFDFRGYGKTVASPALDRVDVDVRAAVDFLRDQGFVRVACFGVGLGGLACAKAAPESDLAGLVLISSPTGGIFTADIYPEDLSSPAYPKLIIVAEEDYALDRPFAEMAQTLYDYAVEPKEIKVFPGSYHSMELLRSEHQEALHALLLDFFEELR